jgi:hypothetical protein
MPPRSCIYKSSFHFIFNASRTENLAVYILDLDAGGKTVMIHILKLYVLCKLLLDRFALDDHLEKEMKYLVLQKARQS